jgi:hypothetical protein
LSDEDYSESELASPESFANVDEAARNAVDRLLISGGRVGLICPSSEQVKIADTLASQLAARYWGMST